MEEIMIRLFIPIFEFYCSNQVLKTIGDISTEIIQKSLVESTIAKFGKLDVLVNNAAIISENCNVSNGTIQQFDDIMNVNVRRLINQT